MKKEGHGERRKQGEEADEMQEVHVKREAPQNAPETRYGQMYIYEEQQQRKGRGTQQASSTAAVAGMEGGGGYELLSWDRATTTTTKTPLLVVPSLSREVRAAK
ncbi:uncharacterized protein [Physcomitrium patens]|uniref:uncharacterized protein n=1 Tax=Physcomitrium patens TaxID=3218 RepID=UPI003CCD0E86